MMPKILTI